MLRYDDWRVGISGQRAAVLNGLELIMLAAYGRLVRADWHLRRVVQRNCVVSVMALPINWKSIDWIWYIMGRRGDIQCGPVIYGYNLQVRATHTHIAALSNPCYLILYYR